MTNRPILSRVRRLTETEDDARFPYASAIDALARRAEDAPERPAFVGRDEAVSYGELWEDATLMARGLFLRGVDRGGRCALALPPGRDLVRLIFAVQALGAAPVLFDPALPASVLLRRIRDARAEVAVCDIDRLSLLGAEVRRVHGRIKLRSPLDVLDDATANRVGDVVPSRRDMALLAATASVRERLRASIFRHAEVMAFCNALADAWDSRRDDVIAASGPPWIGAAAIVAILYPVVTGGCGVMSAASADDESFADWVQDLAAHEVSRLITTEGAARRLAAVATVTKKRLPALRDVVIAGEAPRASTVDAFAGLLSGTARPRSAYSLTEAGGPVAITDTGASAADGDHGAVMAGRPIGGATVRVVDGDGAIAPAGMVGAIEVRGPQLFAGYFDDPSATAAVMHDGWLVTGDLGYLDTEGTLFVLCREADVIRLPDRRIVPREVEEAAASVDKVVDVAAIGRAAKARRDGSPDGQGVAVIVEVGAATRSARDDMAAISTAVTDAVRAAVDVEPEEVLLVESGVIPRAADGRVLYRHLRELVASGRLGREGAILHGGDVFVSPLKR